MNQDGIGGEKNIEEAAKWMTQAAELDHVEAQHQLGHLYENGTGVEKI